MTDAVKAKEKVSVREGTIILPTYDIKGENRNPVFRSQYGVAHIYPYTLLDDIAAQPADKIYRTLVLENQYLRVTVIPDLGGRVYSVFDKVSDREVFYKNDIVKFSPLAIRGAFFSGGVEFSFPVAHAPTTADSVNWDLRQNPDGSASISFGGIEHISRLRWTITLTLFPDRCALAQDVHLFNPTSIPGRYHYWTNASLDADDQTEFIYPLRRVRSYEFAGTASWPYARLYLILADPGLPGMEGVPMWPADRMQTPVNFRWQKNMLAQVSIFGRDVEWDFFGAWQHSANHGYAHYARYRDVSGMKLWSWGNAPVGVVNQTALTDDGSVYAETQCGAMETQLDFDFLKPGKTRQWREWWLPLRGLGGLTCASVDVGARIHLAHGSQEGTVDLTIGLCPSRPVERANLQVSIPGKILCEQTVDISPDNPWLHTETIKAEELAGHPITLTVTDPQGALLLSYTHDRDPSPVEPYTPVETIPPESAEDYYQLGLNHENFDNREQALDAYRKALVLASDHGQAHLRLGLMLLRAADLDDAGRHLSKAAGLGLVEANVYLGVAALLEDRPADARRYFQAVPGDDPEYAASLRGLGKVALREGDWAEAIRLFEESRARSENPVAASVLLALALRQAGHTGAAREVLDSVLSSDPLNHPALRELSLSPGADGQEAAARLNRMLADDRQYYLDLAAFYLDTGLLEDSLQVLVPASQEWDSPMVAYTLAYINHKLGKESDAQTWLQKGTAASPEFGFPSRLEEVIALQHALDRNPEDGKAKYYLGNFLYAHQRYEEGISLWKEALEDLKEFDVLYRNLGLAAWQREQDIPRAVELYEKALDLNPENQDLYLHLDDLYKIQDSDPKREQLLARIKSLPDVREDVRKRKISIMVELGHYQDALDLLEREKFVPLEMDQSFHEVYVDALLQRAADHLAENRIEAAIADYHKALEFPENLGVGAPTTAAQAHIYYLLGLAYERMGRFSEALAAWRRAVSEHHPHGHELFKFIQMSLDKLSRYSELGLEG